MQEHGRITLYLTFDKALARWHHDGGWNGKNSPVTGKASPWQVTNWPGSLRFNAFVRRGRHNLAGTRYDLWFTGPENTLWHGVQYGDQTQVCHCKRLKS
jgi:hypothetical protein